MTPKGKWQAWRTCHDDRETLIACGGRKASSMGNAKSSGSSFKQSASPSFAQPDSLSEQEATTWQWEGHPQQRQREERQRPWPGHDQHVTTEKRVTDSGFISRWKTSCGNQPLVTTGAANTLEGGTCPTLYQQEWASAMTSSIMDYDSLNSVHAERVDQEQQGTSSRPAQRARGLAAVGSELRRAAGAAPLGSGSSSGHYNHRYATDSTGSKVQQATAAGTPMVRMKLSWPPAVKLVLLSATSSTFQQLEAEVWRAFPERWPAGGTSTSGRCVSELVAADDDDGSGGHIVAMPSSSSMMGLQILFEEKEGDLLTVDSDAAWQMVRQMFEEMVARDAEATAAVAGVDSESSRKLPVMPALKLHLCSREAEGDMGMVAFPQQGMVGPMMTTSGSREKTRFCRHFLRGYCWHGEACHFLHSTAAPTGGDGRMQQQQQRRQQQQPAQQAVKAATLAAVPRVGNRPQNPHAAAMLPSSSSWSSHHPAGDRFFRNISDMTRWLQRQLDTAHHSASTSPSSSSSSSTSSYLLLRNLSSDTGLMQLAEVLRQPNLPPDAVSKIVDLVSNEGLRSSMQLEKTNKIYGLLLRSAFLRQLPAHIQMMGFPSAADLKKIAVICEEVQGRMGEGWMEVPLDAIMSRMKEVGEGVQKKELASDLRRLCAQRDKLRRKSALAATAQPGVQGASFRDLPIICTPSEMKTIVTDPRAFLSLLPSNKIGTPFQTIGEYLETHFKLLREDCMEPLRTGIRLYRQEVSGNINEASAYRTGGGGSGERGRGMWERRASQRKDIRVYSAVRVVGIACGNSGVEFRLKFSVGFGRRRFPIRWESSKRLMFGSLLCVSCDDFETMAWAVVSNRNVANLASGLVDVRLVAVENRRSEEGEGTGGRRGGTQDENETVGVGKGGRGSADEGNNQQRRPTLVTGVEYVMVESSSAYFEAYSHVLRSLQRPEMESIPFQRNLIALEPEVSPPEYLSLRGGGDVFDFGCVFPRMEQELGSSKVHILGQWPKWTTSLDPSQWGALKRCLTKEVAVIQGPPGTGKTFLGLVAVRLLLWNVCGRDKQRLRAGGLLGEGGEEESVDLGGEADDEEGLQELLFGDREREEDKESRRRSDGSIRGPILVVCYTNHALDQFLEGIFKFEPNLIRIGGQCRSERLQARNLQFLLNKQRQMRLTERGLHEESRRAKAACDEMEREIGECIERLNLDVVSQREMLHGVATEEQIESLFEGFWQENLTSEADCVRLWLQPPKRRKRRGRERVEEMHWAEGTGGRGGGGGDGSDGGREEEDEGGSEGEVEGERGKVEEDEEEVKGMEEEMMELMGVRGGQREMHILRGELRRAEEEGGVVGGTARRLEEEIVKGRSEEEDEEEEEEDDDEDDDDDDDDYNNDNDDDEVFAMRMLRTREREFRHQQQPIGIQDIDDEGWEDDEEEDERELGTAPLQEFVDYPDVWELPVGARRALHSYWLEELKSKERQHMEELTSRFEAAKRRLQEAENDIQLAMLKRSPLVGMTTTAAARYHELLTSLKPEIVIVEEAAEVLEAHIIACLSPFTRHLILIGDHQQLRPSVAVHHLAREKRLDVSLFERLMRGGIEHSVLAVQHRMRPEIAALIQPIYPSLRNHPSVEGSGRAKVRGVVKDVFFLDHQSRESEVADMASKSNPFEASLVVELCCYLLKQGYSNEQVTILTTYTGQLLEIKSQLRRRLQPAGGSFPAAGQQQQGQAYAHGKFQQLGLRGAAGVERLTPRVCNVDNYQGEECDVILLSLVRSNDIETKDGPGTIGFLRVENRVCVALSRAKCGLYIFGNAMLLASRSPLWLATTRHLQVSDSIGPQLLLSCRNHADVITPISDPSHFAQVADGGCSRPCESRLKCGHACPRRCHPEDHSRIICTKPCLKPRSSCHHICEEQCHGAADVSCPPCKVRVEREMPLCQHKQRMPCHVAVEDFTCQAPCEKHLPGCGHRCPRRCSQPCPSRCEEIVNRMLPCGHSLRMKCYEDPYSIPCPVPCPALLPACSHPCRGTCSSCKQGTQHRPCKQPCKRPLPCGHLCLDSCSNPCPPCQRPCNNRCVHSRCTKACGLPCTLCRERCPWSCPHFRCTKACHEICNRPRCEEPCLLLLRCGHICSGFCGEPCITRCRYCRPRAKEVITQMRMYEFDDEDRFVKLLDCGHVFEASGLDRWMEMEEGGDGGAATVIKLKECPQCRTPIRRSFRYSTVIKQRLAKIEDVKQRVLGFKDTSHGNRLLRNGQAKEALKAFYSALSLYPLLPEAHLGAGAACCSLKNPSQAIQHLKCVVENSSLSDAVHSARLDKLPIRSDSAATSSPRERLAWQLSSPTAGSRNLPQIFPASRLDRGSFENMSSAAASNDVATAAAVQLASALTLAGEFTKSVAFCCALEKKRDVIDDAAMRRIGEVRQKAEQGEQQQVVLAMSSEVGGRGHWYQCPNGHYYTVGECGGPTQLSRCPDCKAVVGGQSHVPAEGNRHANIDGSSMSAYEEEVRRWNNRI